MLKLFYSTFIFFLLPFSWTQANAQDAEITERVPDEYIVVYKPEASVSSKTLSVAALNHNLSLKTSWSNINSYHFKARKSVDFDALKEEMSKNPNILTIEPNYKVKALSLFNRVSTDADLGANSAWQAIADNQEFSRGFSSYRPIVAVIDSGLDVNHDVFTQTERLWVNEGEIPNNGIDDDLNGFIDDVNGWNFVDDSPNVFDDDEFGHGSHVSGIVASSSGPLNYTLSALPPVRVMSLKFLNGVGEGTTADAISAIYYAIENGAKVLNNSWGGSIYSTALHQAVSFSYERDTVFVAAAGNEGVNTDNTPLYPSSLDVPNVISVGASSDTSRAIFSNFGAETVDIFAPGAGIYSTLPGNTYGNLSGTSMSAPFISALAALMFVEAPQFSGYQIREDILATAQSFTQLNGYSATGGRVDFGAAIDQLQTHSTDVNFKPSYVPEFTSRSIASVGNSSNNDSLIACGRVRKSSGGSQSGTSSAIFLLLFPMLLILLFRRLSY